MSVGKLSPHPHPSRRVLEACWALSKAPKQQTDLLDMRVHAGWRGTHEKADFTKEQASPLLIPWLNTSFQEHDITQGREKECPENGAEITGAHPQKQSPQRSGTVQK